MRISERCGPEHEVGFAIHEYGATQGTLSQRRRLTPTTNLHP